MAIYASEFLHFQNELYDFFPHKADGGLGLINKVT